MINLEQINLSGKTANVVYVHKEARKYGEIKTLNETSQGSRGIIVGEVVHLHPLKVSSVRSKTKRVLLLKEVYYDGKYGNRFRVILFGNKATDSVTKNLAVADQLIFVDPLVVTYSNYEVPKNIHQVQLECGTEVNTKERIFMIKKAILNNSVTDLPDIITSQTNNSDLLTCLPVIQLLENEVKQLPKLSKDSNETIQNTCEISLVKDNFKCKPLYPEKNSMMMILDSNEICMDTKYDYIKVSDITKKQYKVNVYTIVVEINEVTTSFLNTRITFKAIDETCKGDEHIIITIIFDKYDEMQNKIKPNAIVRLHRMKISSFNGRLKGTVYKGSDILVVPYPSTSLIASSAKKVPFTKNDKVRFEEMKKWLYDRYMPRIVSRDCVWYTLDSLMPGRQFQIHCMIKTKWIHPISRILVLSVSDGLSCPIKLFQVPVNEIDLIGRPQNFKSNLQIVDVLVETPGQKIKTIEVGTYVVLGPLILTECGLNTNDGNGYKLVLEGNGDTIKELDIFDPAVKRIKQRFPHISTQNPNSVSQDIDPPIAEILVHSHREEEQKELNIDGGKKEGTPKEKRKLFNISDNMEYEAKRRKNNSKSFEDLNCNLSDDNSFENIRITFPIDDEIFFNSANPIQKNEYPGVENKNKETLQLKRKIKSKLNEKILEFNENLDETPGSEISQKSAIMNEVKKKRIDELSQESVDHYFEKLGDLLHKYAKPGRKSSTSPKSIEVPTSNSSRNIQNISCEVDQMSHSSSSIVILEPNNVYMNNEQSYTTQDQTNTKIGQTNSKTCVQCNKGDNIFIIKFVQSPTGQRSHIVVQNNIIQVKLDHTGKLKDQATLMSLFEKYLTKNLNSVVIEKELDKESKALGNVTSNNSTDEFIESANIIDYNTIEVNSNASTVKRDTIHSTNKLGQSMILNSTTKDKINKSLTVGDDYAFKILGHNKNESNHLLEVTSRSIMDINQKVDIGTTNEGVENEQPKKESRVLSWLKNSNFGIRNNDSDEYSAISDVRKKNIDNNYVMLSKGLVQVKGFIMDIQPSLTEEPLNLVSGFCSLGCQNLFLYSSLILDVLSRRVVCPECYKNGKKNQVSYMFMLKIKLLDLTGKQQNMFICKENAERFLECTVKKFLNKLSARKRVLKKLFTSKYNLNHTFAPISCFNIKLVNSQTIILKT